MKKFFAIVLVILLIMGLAACHANKGDFFDSGDRFTIVEHNTCNDSNKIDNYILVDEETGVLYLLLYTSMYRMSMTVLLNTDGTPMTLEEYKNENH